MEKLFDDKLDRVITDEEYQQAKSRYFTQILHLKLQVNELKLIKSEFNTYLNTGFNLLPGIGKNYAQQGIDGKQRIIGSIYPELMIFEENQLRTTRINEVAGLVMRINKAFSAQKKGQIR